MRSRPRCVTARSASLTSQNLALKAALERAACQVKLASRPSAPVPQRVRVRPVNAADAVQSSGHRYSLSTSAASTPPTSAYPSPALSNDGFAPLQEAVAVDLDAKLASKTRQQLALRPFRLNATRVFRSPPRPTLEDTEDDAVTPSRCR